MADDLRKRVLAAVRKGLAAPLDISKTEKPGLHGYSVDPATENAVTNQTTCNRTFPNEIRAVTALPSVSANRDSQPGKVCTVCGAAGDLWHPGEALVHQECARFLPTSETAEPSLAYRKVSAEPDGPGCEVTIIEAQRYRKVFGVLQLRPPALVPVERWQRCVEDGKHFLAKWGDQAEALGWSSADLFGLAPVPDKPHTSFNRLSRYDLTGLAWLLQGRRIVALTEATATIQNAATGNVTIYRRFNKPALGPLGDSLEDFIA